MDDLIKALTILRKYGNPKWPTHCEHDVLTIVDISPSQVSEEDKVELHSLGFVVANQFGEESFISYKFGSA
jgi:hypothetical protein